MRMLRDFKLKQVCLGAALSPMPVYIWDSLCISFSAPACHLVICHELQYCLQFYSNASQLLFSFIIPVAVQILHPEQLPLDTLKSKVK